MKGRPQRTADSNKSRDSLNSSTIQKFLKSPSSDNKQQEPMDTKDRKKAVPKSKGVQGGAATSETHTEGPLMFNMETDPSREVLPTKTEIQDMFVNLEKVIKAEILNVRTDMGHLLARVEGMEKEVEQQGGEIATLKKQVKTLQRGHRELLFKMEEQENQNRRQNLRIRLLPEHRDEDLFLVCKELFNPLMGKNPDSDLKIDRVHRIRKPHNLRGDTPRDIIVKFHQFEDKANIWARLRGARPIKFNNQEIQIYSDLSAGTLARRRQLRPLLDLLRDANLKYRWGFPLSLTVTKEGRSCTLRQMEDLQDFCGQLEIGVPAIPENVFP